MVYHVDQGPVEIDPRHQYAVAGHRALHAAGKLLDDFIFVERAGERGGYLLHQLESRFVATPALDEAPHPFGVGRGQRGEHRLQRVSRADVVRRCEIPHVRCHRRGPSGSGVQEVARRHQKERRRRDYLDVERRGPQHLSIRLRRARRFRVEGNMSSAYKLHGWIGAKVVSSHAPPNAERIAYVRWRKDAQVEHSVILRDRGAQVKQTVQHRAEVGDHGGSCAKAVGHPVYRCPEGECVQRQARPEGSCQVGGHSKPAFRGSCGLAYHGRVDADSGSEGKDSTITKPSQVDATSRAGTEYRHRSRHRHRNGERPCDQIPRPSGENANRRIRFGECPEDLHDRAIAAQGEDRVVIAPHLRGQRCRVTGMRRAPRFTDHACPSKGTRRARLKSCPPS